MNQLKELKVVKKPWGRELWFAQTKNYMGKLLEIDPGEEVSLHKHEKKEETMYVFQGRCQVICFSSRGIKASAQIYYPGSFIHILPREEHCMQATGEMRVILFEVSTPFPEDSIRLHDKYGRPCKKDERRSNQNGY